MAIKEKQNDTIEGIEWNTDNEIKLILAMHGHKPIGINKYFHMVCIWEKFRAAIQKDFPLKEIWDHLETMYDLVTLDDGEDLPFPSKEVEFSLPEEEFANLMKTRKKKEPESKPKEIQKEKLTREVKKEKDVKEVVKKDTVARDVKATKEVEKKKEDSGKKVIKEVEVKKEKQSDVKETKKEVKTFKGRAKSKDEEEPAPSSLKKERKDSESSRESLKRAPKRPTRQSVDNVSKSSSSPRNTPPPKRRRI